MNMAPGVSPELFRGGAIGILRVATVAGLAARRAGSSPAKKVKARFWEESVDFGDLDKRAGGFWPPQGKVKARGQSFFLARAYLYRKVRPATFTFLIWPGFRRLSGRFPGSACLHLFSRRGEFTPQPLNRLG